DALPISGGRLFRVPARILVAVEVPPRHGGIELDPRVALFHRRVGAAGDHDSGIQQAAPGIGAGETALAEARGREMQVADGMAELHGRNDAEASEARNVFRREDLRVLDAPARLR